MSGHLDSRSDFEVIRGGLLELDPETRHQVIASMRLLREMLREMPRQVAVQVLVEAAAERMRAGHPLVRLPA